MLRLIKTDSNMAQFTAVVENPMMVKGFYIDVSGTSAGTAVHARDVGRVNIRARNRDLVSMDFDFLQAINDMEGGVPPRTGDGVIGAFAFGGYLPRFMSDRNVELIEPNDNYTLEIQLGANIAAFCTAFSVSIYADVEQGICTYQPLFHQQSSQYTAAGIYRETFSLENLLKVYISARVASALTLTGSLIGSIVWDVGRRQGSGTLAHLLRCNDIKKLIETTGYARGLEVFSADGAVSSKLDDKMGIQFTTTGASNPQVLMIGALINPDKHTLSEANESVLLASAEHSKQLLGHTRSAAAVRAVRGK